MTSIQFTTFYSPGSHGILIQGYEKNCLSHPWYLIPIIIKVRITQNQKFEGKRYEFYCYIKGPTRGLLETDICYLGSISRKQFEQDLERQIERQQ